MGVRMKQYHSALSIVTVIWGGSLGLQPLSTHHHHSWAAIGGTRSLTGVGVLRLGCNQSP